MRWILILVSCTLIGIIYEIAFSDSKDKYTIQPEVLQSDKVEDCIPETELLHSAFDSVRKEHLISREINPNNIINH